MARMHAARAFAWVVSVPPVAATLLPLVRTPRWWVRVWDYPRLQLAVLLGAAGTVQWAARPRGPAARALLGATVGALAWQCSRVASYTPLRRPQVAGAAGADPARTIALLVANVLQHNRNSEAFLARVRTCDPDIVFAVETDDWWDAALAPLMARYPWHVRHPLSNTYGLHLFSRLELRDVRVRERVEAGVPSVSAQVRLRDGTWVDLHCVHPKPPQVGRDVEERDAELMIVARETAGTDRPTIVCGDLNDVAWSHTTRLFQRVSGLLDPRIGRGLFPTFHAGYWFARWPLDHVFFDASFHLHRLEVLDAFGSDHFPVFIRLVHNPSGARRHRQPQADADDQAEASERIAEGLGAAADPARSAARADVHAG